MPNWISNEIEMVGNEDTIKEIFRKHFVNGRFDYDTIIPQPKTMEECPKEYVCDAQKEHIEPDEERPWFNWYKWNYDNWGVKWNACETCVWETGFYFESPWDCPITILEKLAELYPNVRFKVSVDGEIDEPYKFALN